MHGHLSRRRVAKLRVEIYDNDSTNAAIKIQSVHRGRKARQEILNGVNNTNTSLSNTNTRTSNINENVPQIYTSRSCVFSDALASLALMIVSD